MSNYALNYLLNYLLNSKKVFGIFEGFDIFKALQKV